MVKLCNCNTLFEAEIIKGRLDDAGIPCEVINKNLNLYPPYNTGVSGINICVVVAEESYDEALTLINSTNELNNSDDYEVKCPACGSNDVTAKAAPLSIKSLFLFIGSTLMFSSTKNPPAAAPVYTCNKCKHKFSI